ncbi:MAG TPA: TauD/TfdA family dioxygenase [Polyangium sp.]|nr:TauD/TfdA family dioxygenase [Polyangium sp.]
MSKLHVNRIATHIGAEISGADLSSPISAETVEVFENLLLEHLVLFFRDQNLDVAQVKAFAKHFGDLHIHPVRQELAAQGHPEVLVQRTGVERPYVPSEWHADVTFNKNPPKAAPIPKQAARAFSSIESLRDTLSA